MLTFLRKPFLVVLLLGCGAGNSPAQDLELPPPAVNPPALPPRADEAGYLGMTVDLSQADRTVFIESVADGGPAAQGGLKPNDVILEVGGTRIATLDDLGRLVRQPPGTKLTFKVQRAGVVQRFDVVVAAQPVAPGRGVEPAPDELPELPELPEPAEVAGEGTPVAGTEGGPPLVEDSRPQLGIGVTDAARLNEADRLRLGVVVDSGAVISRINEGAPAARAGLPLGGVVVSINGQRIGTAQDIVDLVRTFKPGQEIEVTYWEGDRLGRKKVRVGSTVVAVTPGAGLPGISALRPRRLGTDRPVLNALERLLDDVLPPAPAARGRADAGEAGGTAAPAVPPPPPAMAEPKPDLPEIELELPEPAEPPAAATPDATSAGSASSELQELLKQAEEIQKQLDRIRQRINELEAKRAMHNAR